MGVTLQESLRGRKGGGALPVIEEEHDLNKNTLTLQLYRLRLLKRGRNALP
jgi:hypothetical protein